jgi:DNA-binding NarL/FixJ family response regulator
MSTLIVIDTDPATRSLVVATARAHFRLNVIEAPNGMTGLDLIRHSIDDLVLVVLDINLPDLDGLDICLRIREIADQHQHPIQILPLSEIDAIDIAHFFREAGYAPLLTTPTTPEHLAAAMRAAMNVHPGPLPQNAFVRYALRKAAQTERTVRQKRELVPVALFATAPALRTGLHQLLVAASVHILLEASSIVALRQLLVGMREGVDALVTAASDRAIVVDVAQTFAVPLIVIAATQEEARDLTMDTPILRQAHAVVDASGEQATLVLAEAMEALRCGERYIYLPSDRHTTSHTRDRTIPESVAQLFAATLLTPREVELVWLDYQGGSATQIAERLGISPQSITRYWNRIYHKLQIAGEARRARGYVHTWIQSVLHSPNPSQENDQGA